MAKAKLESLEKRINYLDAPSIEVNAKPEHMEDVKEIKKSRPKIIGCF